MSKTYRFITVVFMTLSVSACHEQNPEWELSTNSINGTKMVLVDGNEVQEVKICLDKKRAISFPTTVVADYDDQMYAGLLVGQCMYFKGKKVSVRLATPSSGKLAKGTYKIITKE